MIFTADIELIPESILTFEDKYSLRDAKIDQVSHGSEMVVSGWELVSFRPKTRDLVRDQGVRIILTGGI